MKMFFDTEFTGLHKNTTLISLGVVYENGIKFYAEFTDYDKEQVDDWLENNVIKNLELQDMTENSIKCCEGMKIKYVKGTKEFIAQELDFWHQYHFQDQKLEVWSDCMAYDWVLFCDMYGHAFNIPKDIYYIPFDICTLMKLKGVDPDISREQFAGVETGVKKHNSLWDAEIIQKCYKKLAKGSEL